MRRIFSMIKAPPRIPELLFAAVLIWLFATGQGWSVLLADGDTGWHIRNGEQIIDSRSVPHRDAFSFDSSGHPWFSWEWLSDVLFAALYRKGGLQAVALFCGITIAACVSVLFRHIVWRGVGVCIALPLTLLAVGASSVHYLARPHVVGLLFFAVTAWLIDRGRRRREEKRGAALERFTWSLPLIFLFWANCHGSFLAGLAMLGIWCAETAIETAIESRRIPMRPLLVMALSGVATLCNPYGWHLHAHAIEYLRSAWIQASIEEFQSPRFRSESMFQYEILLIAGLCAVPLILRRRQFYPGCVIVLWAHESLASVRHVPLYCLAACPFIASWLQHQWDRARRRSRAGSLFPAFDSINVTWHAWTGGFTIWPVLVCIVVGMSKGFAAGEPASFPANKFPVSLVERNLNRFRLQRGRARRVFSSDQWSDYLIFRLYPDVRVFFDGRSDYFGPWRGEAYQQLMAAEPDSPTILDREKVDLALLPKKWALSGLLRSSGEWQIADGDEQCILFARNPTKNVAATNQKTPDSR